MNSRSFHLKKKISTDSKTFLNQFIEMQTLL